MASEADSSLFIPILDSPTIEVPITPCTAPRRAQATPLKFYNFECQHHLQKNHNSTNMDPIELALQDLKLMDPPDISAAARNRGCNRSILSCRWNKKTGIKEDADINK